MDNEKELIILVDDNLTNLKIGKALLSENYRAATAPSAEKMFSLLEKNRPAMILLDIDMPTMDGYEAIQILKSNQATKDIPVIFLTAKTESGDELLGLSLGAVDYITKPFGPALLLKRIDMHLKVESQRKDLQYFNDNFQKIVEEKIRGIFEIQNAMLKTMGELVEYRDDITGRHIERTQQWVRILLEELKRSDIYTDETKEWDIDLLVQSCQLHDVGKISISDRILKKPSKLTEAEFNDMKIHTHIGKQIMEKVEDLTSENEFLKYAKIFAVSHHEKWDGTGYPYGLRGKEIPLLGRIMAIADVYDALTSVRPYKKPFSHEDAVKIITDGSGLQFDPVLVDAFIRTKEQFRNAVIF
ncbi:MAG: response regulator [Treponema sp.]|nr:response regulator [Treponema sp.]